MALPVDTPDQALQVDGHAPGTDDAGPASPSRLLYWIAGIFFVECLVISYLRRPWLSNLSLKPMLIVFCGVVLLLGGGRLPAAEPGQLRFYKGFAALHVLAIVAVARVYLFLLGSAVQGEPLGVPSACLWYSSLVFLFSTLAVTLSNVSFLARSFASLGRVWGYATACALLTIPLREFLQSAWNAPQSALGRWLQICCLRCVVFVLRLLYPRVLYDPGTATVGTPAFLIGIAGGCSGVEGLGLIAAVSFVALFFYRRRLRLARAALLVPLALVAVWMLNVVRIVLLIAIGNAGHIDVALGGFHSAGGWIFFNLTAITFLVVVHRLPWTHRTPLTGHVRESRTQFSPANTVAASLVPFLAILACSLVARAASSGGFEGLYPLRLAGGLFALWLYREQYRRGELAESLRVTWRSAWLSVMGGVAIAFLWIALNRFLPQPAAGDPTGAALAQLPAWQRIVWIYARVVAAAITVPLAEELAFRWYLARRIAGAWRRKISLRHLNGPSILLSSAAFGLLHGRMWVAGIVSGVLLALLAKRRGHLGDAVVAHATSNLLLAAWVLARHDFALW